MAEKALFVKKILYSNVRQFIKNIPEYPDVVFVNAGTSLHSFDYYITYKNGGWGIGIFADQITELTELGEILHAGD